MKTLENKKGMTALEISRSNYNRFEDKKEITELNNALLSVESEYAKRTDDGYKIEGEFNEGVSSAVADVMRNEFIAHHDRYSLEIIELCADIMERMKY